jgi:hypothetical protein
MTRKLALLLLIALLNRSTAYRDDSAGDLELSDSAGDQDDSGHGTINWSDEFNDDQSLDDDIGNVQQRLFTGAQLDFSRYEDFYDIELPARATELNDDGGTGATDEALRWPQDGNRIKVPFEVDERSGYSRDQQKNIMDAMKEIQSKTCIKFVKRLYERNYIMFKSDQSEFGLDCTKPFTNFVHSYRQRLQHETGHARERPKHSPQQGLAVRQCSGHRHARDPARSGLFAHAVARLPQPVH